MGRIDNAINMLQNALGGLFPTQPASPSLPFPENAPSDDSVATITIRKDRSNSPSNPESSSPMGKITSYNWKGDPYTDTNSRNWIGSWGKINEIGMAVSPDIEKQFREAGIKPKDKVMITLSDGTQLERVWDNRTMQDKQAIKKYGKPLKGRFDLHHPYGDKPHEKDGVSVVGFQKLDNPTLASSQ
jgi:hypothetical protein